MRLFRKSIASMAQILENGGDKTRLRAIEMVWTSMGRLPPKGAHVTPCNHNHLAMGTPGRRPSDPLGSGLQLDHEDARAAMRLLIRERERQRDEAQAKGDPQASNGHSPPCDGSSSSA